MRGSRLGLAMTLAVGLLAVPLVGGAQPPSKISRVGVIGETSATDPFLTAFRQGLRGLGYTEGGNIVIEYRYAQGVLARVPGLAAELIRLRVDVLVVGGTVAAQAARTATKTVPIVFTLAGDPVRAGLVASLAHPGGNATGLSNFAAELAGKQLELLKAAVPRASRVAVLYNPATPAGAKLKQTREVAQALGLELDVLKMRQPNELTAAFSALTRWRAEALLVLSDPVFGSVLGQLAKLAAEHHLPAMYLRREFVEAGGLLAYGPSFSDNYRRAATYVDKILKGANPADLPVEQPTKFEFVINLKTAKALGLTIPPSVLARADEIIQ